MNVCFVVPDGTGIRNYLFSDLLKKLDDQDVKIWIWHALTQNAIEEIRKIHPNIKIQEKKLPVYREGFGEKFLREAIAYARLNHNAKLVDNPTILVNWRKNPKKLTHKIFYKLVEIFGKYLSKDYNKILKSDEKYIKKVSTSHQLNEYKEFLISNKIDSVLCTHQRAITAVPAMQAANLNNIHTISAIYSWDNMPKARLATRSKEYIVWSEYMKEEMNLYYPEINQDSVVITGTPQFEFYYNEDNLVSKEEFFKKYDLDITKKVICYSGDDSLTSPYDPDYLEDLAQIIQTSELKEKVQILLRRAPVDLSGRFDEIAKKFSDIIKIANPIWNFDGEGDNWTLIYPSMDDISLLVNTAYHCDLVYNVGSTMAHDFAVFNKPAAYINYDVKHAKNWSTRTIYKYQHFRTQLKLEAVAWVNSKEEIGNLMNNILVNNTELAKDKQKWLNVISNDTKLASTKISYLLNGKK